MKRLDRITNRFAARAAAIGGAALLACGIGELLSPQHSQSRVVGVSGHLILGFFALGCIAVAPTFVVLAHRVSSKSARYAGAAAFAGTLLLGLTSITSLVNGTDLGLFNLLAPITNAGWFVGSLVLCVALLRAKRLPAALAIGLVVAYVAAIPLATLGGGLIAGVYFVTLAYRVLGDSRSHDVATIATIVAA